MLCFRVTSNPLLRFPGTGACGGHDQPAVEGQRVSELRVNPEATSPSEQQSFPGRLRLCYLAVSATLHCLKYKHFSLKAPKTQIKSKFILRPRDI